MVFREVDKGIKGCVLFALMAVCGKAKRPHLVSRNAAAEKTQSV
jgi:hypothetical protein